MSEPRDRRDDATNPPLDPRGEAAALCATAWRAAAAR
jgi:hypothetical protein